LSARTIWIIREYSYGVRRGLDQGRNAISKGFDTAAGRRSGRAGLVA
jgi:hypothetical protein